MIFFFKGGSMLETFNADIPVPYFVCSVFRSENNEFKNG